MGHFTALPAKPLKATAAGELGNSSTMVFWRRDDFRIFSSKGIVATSSNATSKNLSVTLESLAKSS